MNLHALRVFFEVANRKSVTGAAIDLAISQPSVTAQIRKLENEIGVKVLEPNGRGIRLTEAGELIYLHAQRMFAMEKELERKLDDFRKGKIGTLRIASTGLPANVLLPKWVATFKKENPDVDIIITVVNSSEANRQLLHYEADLAIIAGISKHPDIFYEKLFDDELWFIVPKGHRLDSKKTTLDEMMEEPFFMREEGSSIREQLLALCRIHDLSPPKMTLRYNGMNMSIKTIQEGYGAMLVPALVVKDMVEKGEIGRVFIEGIDMKRPIYFCSRKDDDLSSPVTQSFYEVVKRLL
ncbi:LysR family transcriptional regulator [Brevibacillus fluminis]|uniref:LysR family transcriptional regulator n=1 Tax=Brevibacillus fluminis TaxID=511487 RepID=A0A3M8D997_9BACL|nr:LysR family transcriptional regulator [Brevibacillus fluminis]RNB84624.1 LysR family transcriptional regulator [Brevibacillus fluminis]